jgi:hypothetical protein
MTETCTACGAQASGRFCNQCGAAVAAACRECGNPLPRGARFCNQCGASAAPAEAAAAPRRASVLPWAVAGVAVVALLTVVLLRRSEPAPAAPGPFVREGEAAAAAGTGGAAAVDLASMTPREAADRLFNRVMTAVSEGDTAEAERFVPMAVQAYGMAGPLDSDGRYHLAALHLVARDWGAARAQADTILASDERHLFGLFTAAKAAEGAGDAAGAQALFRRFLEAYPTQAGRDLPEYRDHQQGLPAMRQEAERATGAPAAGG